jgi:hypothetical protein
MISYDHRIRHLVKTKRTNWSLFASLIRWQSNLAQIATGKDYWLSFLTLFLKIPQKWFNSLPLS